MSDGEAESGASGRVRRQNVWELQVEIATKEIAFLKDKIKTWKEFGRQERLREKEEAKETKKEERERVKEFKGMTKHLEQVEQKVEKGATSMDGKKRKRGAAGAGPEKKARKPSGYNVYMGEALNKCKVDQPDMAQKDRMKLVAEGWKSMSDDEKKVFNDRAAEMAPSSSTANMPKPKSKNVKFTPKEDVVMMTPVVGNPNSDSDEDSDTLAHGSFPKSAPNTGDSVATTMSMDGLSKSEKKKAKKEKKKKDKKKKLKD